MMAAAGVWLLLLLITAAASSAPHKSQPEQRVVCPHVCTCRHVARGHVPLVRWHEKGDGDDDSDHHWNYYHQHHDPSGVSTEPEPEQADAEPVLSAVCWLQHDTEVVRLMTELSPDTQFLSLLQAPDMQPTYLRHTEFAGLPRLEGLEIHGYHEHTSGGSAPQLQDNRLSSLLSRGLPPSDEPRHQQARITLGPAALQPLTGLRYVSLQHVLLSPQPSDDGAQPRYRAARGQRMFDQPLLLKQPPLVVPYEQFRLHAAPRYATFANLTALRLLRLSHTQLDSISWHLLEGLDSLRQLVIEHQPLAHLPNFAFYGCPNLHKLSLANNRLEINMKHLAGLLDLQTLDLSSNLISELTPISLAPFPQLRELNLFDNPIQVVYPGALAMMNMTEVLHLGDANTPLHLTPHALDDLPSLRELTVRNISTAGLIKEQLSALPRLSALEVHGSVRHVPFDTFSENRQLTQLNLSSCELSQLSQDALLGLDSLQVLDLSHNQLTELPAELLSPLPRLREVYIHHNRLAWLSPAVLRGVRPKLLQLQHNPWHCNCKLAFLSAAVTNKVRAQHVTTCRWQGTSRTCRHERRQHLTYDARAEPRCHTPARYRHWGLYEVLQQQLRCHRRGAAARQVYTSPADRVRYQASAESPTALADHADSVDYELAADDVAVLEEYMDDVDYELSADDAPSLRDDASDEFGDADYGEPLANDEAQMMAEYAADYEYDDYDTGPAVGGGEVSVKTRPEPPVTSQHVTEPSRASSSGSGNYVPVSPELFALLSKKAQKLELERMNPKFRKHYRL